MVNYVKLGDIGEIFIGLTYKPENVSTEGMIVLRSSNIQDGELDFNDTVRVNCPVRENLLVKPNDILMCSRNGSAKLVGKCTMLPRMSEPMTFGAFMTIIRTPYNSYLRYFFDSSAFRNQIKGSATTTINQITRKMLDEIEVPVFDVESQIRITTQFEKLSKLIAMRKEQLAKLDELVKARFVEMFGDSLHNRNTVSLEEISDFVTVGIANSATHAYADSGIVMLRNQNIKENYLDDNDLIYITPDFAKKYGSKQLAENDILVIRTGYPGVACLVPKKYEGCQTFTTLIVRLKNSTPAHTNYVCHYINSSFGKGYVEQSKVGVAQQNFGAKALAKMPIAVPPMELQEQFAAFVEQTNKTKLTIQASLDKLEVMKKALMQEYFE